MTTDPVPTAEPHPAAGGDTAAERTWARSLAGWRIPDEILSSAPQSPWIHPVDMFRITDDAPADTPSHARARERVPPGGSVLDVGCGGGRAAFALAPPAVMVIGVDHQEAMLEAFAEGADRRGLEHREILGDWPGVAEQAPVADVAVCHHVAYNVAGLGPFAQALDAHARRRVVLELPWRHPLSWMTPLWRHFWGLERPDGPTADDALAVMRALGFDARLEEWDDAPGGRGAPRLPQARRVEFARIRLCLPADRDPEVAAAMAELDEKPRRRATIWWDAGSRR